MPAALVNGPDGEKAWEKAKALVREQYPDLDPDDDAKSAKFYALATTIYKSVCKSPKYDCGSGEREEAEFDWKAMAALLRPVHEEQMGKVAKVEDLVAGTMVVVATLLGRTVSSGRVLKVEADTVHVALKSSGVDQTQGFPTSIYKFYTLDKEEGANLAENVGIAPTSQPVSTVPVNPDDSPTTGALPAKPDNAPPSRPLAIILGYTLNDLRWASTVWDDIGHYGFTRAMTRHGLPVGDQAALLAQLIAEKIINDAGYPEPEWVQAVQQ
jgi:hypothetical protein